MDPWSFHGLGISDDRHSDRVPDAPYAYPYDPDVDDSEVKKDVTFRTALGEMALEVEATVTTDREGTRVDLFNVFFVNDWGRADKELDISGYLTEPVLSRIEREAKKETIRDKT